MHCRVMKGNFYDEKRKVYELQTMKMRKTFKAKFLHARFLNSIRSKIIVVKTGVV